MLKFHFNLFVAGIILTLCGLAIEQVAKDGRGFFVPLKVTPKTAKLIYFAVFIGTVSFILWLFSDIFSPAKSGITTESEGFRVHWLACIAFIIICGFPFVNYFYGNAMAYQGLAFGIKTAAWVTITVALGFVADYLVRGGANINSTQILSAVGGGVCLYFYFVGSKGGA